MARKSNLARKADIEQPEIGEAQAAPEPSETTSDKVERLAGTDAKVKVRNVFALDTIEREDVEAGQAKAKLLSEVRQRLSEAADLAAEGADADASAGSIADDCGVRLFNGVVDGILSKDEVSSTLGDIFGFRKKGDAKIRVPSGDKDASKTPFGLGEHIRKRIVRAVSAVDFTETDDDGNFVGMDAGGRFFEGLDPEEIAPIVDALESGGSLWSAYDQMTKLKAGLRSSVNAAFDPAKVAKMVEALEGEGAVDMLDKNRDLLKAYQSLMAVLNDIGEEIGERRASAEQE